MKTTDKEKSQVEKFREAARELETDDSEEAFDRLVKKISSSRPAERPNPPQTDD